MLCQRSSSCVSQLFPQPLILCCLRTPGQPTPAGRSATTICSERKFIVLVQGSSSVQPMLPCSISVMKGIIDKFDRCESTSFIESFAFWDGKDCRAGPEWPSLPGSCENGFPKRMGCNSTVIFLYYFVRRQFYWPENCDDQRHWTIYVHSM